jgi:hypothetical protein
VEQEDALPDTPSDETKRSEKRFTVWFERATLGFVEEPLAIILPVVKDGLWHKTQPISENMPFHSWWMVCRARAWAGPAFA